MADEQTTQLLLAMCATCAHTKASHPEDRECSETWTVDDGKREVRCRCSEYWAKRRDVEDGMPVTERQVGFGGSIDIGLPAHRHPHQHVHRPALLQTVPELRGHPPVQLRSGRRTTSCGSRGSCGAEQVFFVQPGQFDRSRVVDVFGNEVDPETGEIVEA